MLRSGAVAFAVAALAAVAACQHHCPTPKPPVSCASPNIQPAFACKGQQLARYDGCRWECASIFEFRQLDEQQPFDVATFTVGAE